MKYYIRFKHLSTGYIEGTIPPQFSVDNIKPIDLLGSDGVAKLDARLNLNSMVIYAHKVIDRHHCKSQIVGFEIIRANNFRDEGRVVLRWFKPNI